MLTITPIYAAFLTFIFLFLSVRTLQQRRIAQVTLGNGEDKELIRRVRVHANFAEYVPIALIMAAFVEMQGAHWILSHVVCFSLVIGRLSHAYGVSQSNENFKYRVFGMAMTFTSMGISSIIVAILAIKTYL